MYYQYRKNQIFRRKLNIPEEVKERIYNNKSTLDDFIKYDLYKKVPNESLLFKYRYIVSTLGYEKTIALDWECLDQLNENKLYEIISTYKNDTDNNINTKIYQAIKQEYQNKMKSYNSTMSNRDDLLDIEKVLNYNNYKLNFELLGNRFVNSTPELFYSHNFNILKALLNGDITIASIIENIDELRNIPFDYLLSRVPNEDARIILNYIKEYLQNDELYKQYEGSIKTTLKTLYDNNMIASIAKSIKNNNLDVDTLFIKIALQRFAVRPDLMNADEIFKIFGSYSSLLKEYYKLVDDKKITDFLYLNDLSAEILSYMDEHSLEDYFYDFISKYNIVYDESLPQNFKDKHPNLFLGNDVSPELKNKFYSKKISVSDVSNNIESFKNVNFILGLDLAEAYRSKFELLTNDSVLTLIRSCDEEAKKMIFDYFLSIADNFDDLAMIRNAGFENDYIKETMEAFKQLLQVRPELDIYNPALSIKLIQKKIVENFGYDVISGILEYNSGANEIFIKYADEPQLLISWINYIKSLSIYNNKLLHLSILNYPKSISLIENLINSNMKPDDKQVQYLYEILVQRNIYEVSNLNQLINYPNYRKEKLMEKIQSNSIYSVKDGIMETLFNVGYYEGKNIVKTYGLGSELFVSNVLLKRGLLNEETQVLFEIIKTIDSINDCEELRTRFNSIINNGEMIDSLIEIEQEMKKIFNKIYSDNLFRDKVEQVEGLKHLSVSGLNIPDMLDVKGRPISNQIPVVELDGIEFKLLIHKLHDYDPSLKNFASQIIDNPAKWNQLEGASTLSTSMISDKNLNRVNGSLETSVYYGFNDISNESIMLMGPRDIYVQHGGRHLEPTSRLNTFMLPDVLQNVTYDYSYNEIALDRKSSNSKEFGGRIQPNCIICFDNIINDNSKKAAQYFNVPIYNINSQKYKELNSKYIDINNINSSNEKDIKNILFTRGLELKDKVSMSLELCDKALSNNLISKVDYNNRLIQIIDIVSEYSGQKDVSNIDLAFIKSKLDNANMEVSNEQQR